MAGQRILILGAERDVAEAVRKQLRFAGFTADVAASLAEGEALLSKSLYDVAIVDPCLPDARGIEAVAKCREIDPAMGVLVLAAFGTVEAAARALELGPKDFLAKPARQDHLLAAVEQALNSSRLAREARALQQRFRGTASFGAIVGDSPKFREALDLAAKVAKSDLSVVICGETGTGKELVAAAIHDASPRAGRAMVTAVVAAGPDPLQKSALFGHLRGSFTDAKSSRKGFFQEADKSTLFLDEIAEISLETQVALLRAIEKKWIRPVGGEEEIPVDVRILSATNRDLRAEVEARRFREDLYYRIGVIFVNIPPLRERLEDIPLLAAHFVRQCVGQGHGIPDIAPEAIAALRQYHWPGNVRELRNVMERAVLLSGGETVGASHCFPQVPLSASGGPERCFDLPLREASDRFAKDYLMRLLAKYGGDSQKVADHAGMHVTHIRRKIRELGIHAHRRRSDGS